jgi:hypothetical protein
MSDEFDVVPDEVRQDETIYYWSTAGQFRRWVRRQKMKGKKRWARRGILLGAILGALVGALALWLGGGF